VDNQGRHAQKSVDVKKDAQDRQSENAQTKGQLESRETGLSSDTMTSLQEVAKEQVRGKGEKGGIVACHWNRMFSYDQQ